MYVWLKGFLFHQQKPVVMKIWFTSYFVFEQHNCSYFWLQMNDKTQTATMECTEKKKQVRFGSSNRNRSIIQSKRKKNK